LSTGKAAGGGDGAECLSAKRSGEQVDQLQDGVWLGQHLAQDVYRQTHPTALDSTAKWVRSDRGP